MKKVKTQLLQENIYSNKFSPFVLETTGLEILMVK